MAISKNSFMIDDVLKIVKERKKIRKQNPDMKKDLGGKRNGKECR